jgi:hypothetical protein
MSMCFLPDTGSGVPGLLSFVDDFLFVTLAGRFSADDSSNGFTGGRVC